MKYINFTQLNIFMISLILASCGGGSATGITVTVSPVNEASDVDTNVVITATFEEDMNGSTFNTNSFSLLDSNGNEVAGVVSYNVLDKSASFTPDEVLTLLTTYTMRVDETITNINSQTIRATSASFTTRDGAWSSVALVENDPSITPAYPQTPAFDGNLNGNLVAVWTQRYLPTAVTKSSVWANYYNPGTGWETEMLLETDDSGNASDNVDVAIDVNGNAIAIWVQTDASMINNIWVNRYTVGSGWGTAESIDTGNLSAASPQISFGINGNAIAVWTQFDPVTLMANVWTNRYVIGSGWGIAKRLESNPSGFAYVPKIAIDANGNAIAIWHKDDGSRYNIWASYYSAGIGWGAAELIESDDFGSAQNPSVEFDFNGNAHAVWMQDGTSTEIFNTVDILTSRYTAGVGWGQPEKIESDYGPAKTPRIWVDPEGNATAVWTQSINAGNAYEVIVANYYDVDLGWGTSSPPWANSVALSVSVPFLSPDFAYDESGNGVLVWHQPNSFQSPINIMFSMRYLKDVGWDQSSLYAIRNVVNNPRNPKIEVNKKGSAIVLWTEGEYLGNQDYRYDIYYQQFD